MSESTATGFPLSAQQSYLWTLAAEPSALQVTVAVEIRGDLQLDRLLQALNRVIAQHEILRTCFVRRPGMKLPLQVIQETLAPVWRVSDLRSLDENQQNERVSQAFAQETATPFALDRGPTIRSLVLQLGDSRHVCILSVPSLCADTLSVKHLLQQLADAYRGKALADEVFQYADFSAWQNELLEQEDEESKQGKGYWRELLEGFVARVKLPFELTPSAGAWQPAAMVVEAPLELPSRVTHDPASFYAACWHLLQWRMTGQNGIVLGYLCDGRNHEEIAGSIGLFSKVLPVPYEFEPNQSFLAVLESLRRTRSEAYRQQDYLSLEANTRDLWISFAEAEVPASLSANGLEFSVLTQEINDSLFRTQLRWLRGPRSSRLELRYDPSSFAHSTAERMSQSLTVLMQNAAQNPGSKISELEILSDRERERVVVEFNRTIANAPRHPCVHYQFEECAAATPHQPALRFGEVSLTYAQLNQRANQLAHRLRRSGVGANVPVGLLTDRSAEMIIAVLGILKSGGAYVPLLPDNPSARLAHQLTETQSPVLVTEKRHLANLPEFAGQVICLDGDVGGESTENPEHVNSTEDTVYVIYTSGSTGLPKGVAVTHGNLSNYAQFIATKLQAEGNALHFATVSTLAADLGNTAIFPALISGGCLHVISYETATAANLFARYAELHPIDVLKITPSHLNSLLSSPEGLGIVPRKYLVLGGEPASFDLVRRAQAQARCAVINHYGPTEATVGCCTFDAGEDVSAWSPATVPIGRPIANAQVYVCDSRLRPVPIGAPGELCVAGAGIAKGYLNQPQQTAERFLKSPFGGGQLYRTGDLARFLPDGNVEFLGRIDQQVKIRGFRVEPAEIENVLKKHPAVRQAVVVAREAQAGDKRLLAYVVASSKPTPPSIDDLRSFLAQQLPDYMVPSAIVRLEALPLTRNGKVDLAALPSPDGTMVERSLVAPRNPVEQELLEIWRQVLKIDRFGVEDNFFDLGGHSLLATQVISRVRSAFHVQLPLRSLFDAPTVAELADEIARMPQSSEEDELARVLRELEGLSDEEAERLLANEIETAGEGSDSGTR